jgi:flagellar biosynthesis anti-sigma factor FlgM
MKIRNDAPQLPTDRTADADRVTPSGATNARATQGAAATDQLALSPEAQLLKATLDRAAGEPEIRQDLVRRMRELDARGELGRDAGKLADAILDNWLGGPREGDDA